MRYLLAIPILFLSFHATAQSFHKAQLIAKDSTLVPVEIQKNYLPVHGHNTNLFDVIKIREKTVFPQEVIGYIVGKKIYKSLEIKNGQSTLHIFAEQLQNGPAFLYYYNGLYFGQRDIYIFRKPQESYYYVSLEPQLVGGGQNTSPNMAPDIVFTTQINQLLQNWSDERIFKSQFTRYFSDCEKIVNQFKQDWYTPSSIKSLFQEYNTSCSSTK